MNVQLPAELERFLSDLVDGGSYDSRDLAIHDALWLLKSRFDLEKVRTEELKRLIAVGVEQADRGDVIDGEEVFRRLHEKVQTHSEATSR